VSIAAAALVLLSGAPSAHALDKIHAAKSAGVAWAFIPLDVGVDQGIFQKYGLDVDITVFAGDQKMQQALLSGSIDFGLGGGPAMSFTAKGAPIIGVAALFGAPKNISIVVANDSPLKSPADLKGKMVSSSAVGSLTAWLVQQVAIQQGWGPDGIKIAALGGFDAGLAALRTHQVDGMSSSVEGGLLLEEQKIGRNLTDMEHFAPNFVTHVVFTRRDLLASNPDVINRFLKGLFATIAYMKTHKAETSKVAVSELHETPGVADKTYDDEIASFVPDGHFDPKGIAVLKKSFLDMEMLKTEPTDEQMFTTQFLPVKP
jgi:NitT/TauT family transport system substrate-binding protein